MTARIKAAKVDNQVHWGTGVAVPWLEFGGI